MKILAVADLHGQEKSYFKLSSLVKKNKPDLIISAGDHTWFGEDEKKMLKKLDFGIPVLLLPGNHEIPAATQKAAKGMKHIVWLHKGAYEVSDVLVLGCGEGGFGVGNYDFEKSKAFFVTSMKKHEGKTILVTHEPPFDTKADEIMPGSHVGSKSLRNFIKETQPDIHICGHIHESAGAMSKLGKTLVINAGPKGKIIEV
jgi:uncharacterized protein